MVFSFRRKCGMVRLVRINLQATLITPYFYSVKDPLYQLQHHVREFHHCQQINIIGITLSIYTTSIEPWYQIIDEAPEEWWWHVFLWATPGHCNLPGESLIATVARRPSRVALIHRTVVELTPHVTRAVFMESRDVKLNDPFISRKTPRADWCWSSALSSQNTSWWRAVSTDLPPL